MASALAAIEMLPLELPPPAPGHHDAQMFPEFDEQPVPRDHQQCVAAAKPADQEERQSSQRREEVGDDDEMGAARVSASALGPLQPEKSNAYRKST